MSCVWCNALDDPTPESGEHHVWGMTVPCDKVEPEPEPEYVPEPEPEPEPTMTPDEAADRMRYALHSDSKGLITPEVRSIVLGWEIFDTPSLQVTMTLEDIATRLRMLGEWSDEDYEAGCIEIEEDSAYQRALHDVWRMILATA